MLTIEPGVDLHFEAWPDGTHVLKVPVHNRGAEFDRRVWMGARTLIKEFYLAEDGDGAEDSAIGESLDPGAWGEAPADDSPEARHHDEILMQINATNNVKP